MPDCVSPKLARSSPLHHLYACIPFVMDVESKAASGAEKVPSSAISVEPYLDAGDKDKVQRKLKQRHVQMCVVLLSFSACSP